MKAFLLAAGIGSRLRPLTYKVPKCLIKINNEELIDIWIKKILNLGIDKIYINIHYKSDDVIKHFESSKFKKNIHLIYEKELLGTGGSLIKHFNKLNEDLLVVHCDNFTTDTLLNFKEKYLNRPPNIIASLLAFRTNYPNECGILETDDNKILINMDEKVENPSSNLANGACYIFSNEAMKLIIKNKNIKDISLDVIPMLYNKINIYETIDYYEDIGSIEKLEKTEQYVKNRCSDSKL